MLVIAAALRFGLVEPPPHGAPAAEATFRSLFDALRDALRGVVPGMRAIFVAALLLQLTFQTFTTWFALHGTERFGVRPEDVTIGFIAWAIGGVIGALPAGFVGVRFGRRNAMLLGFAHHGRVPRRARSRDEHVAGDAAPRARVGGVDVPDGERLSDVRRADSARAARRALRRSSCCAWRSAAAIGDPMNGALFDLFGSYRPLFLMMAAYTALAFVAVLRIPRGAGEAGVTPLATALEH